MTTARYTPEESIQDFKALRQLERDISAFLNRGADLLERLVRDPYETRFRRLDGQTDPEQARIEQDRAGMYKPGQVSMLTPEVNEIHQMDNPSHVPTAKIHVYGHDLLGLNRCRFDPGTGKISRFMTQRYNNYPQRRWRHDLERLESHRYGFAYRGAAARDVRRPYRP